eukprot:1140283-Pelagomonas_calceolata.AAC.3
MPPNTVLLLLHSATLLSTEPLPEGSWVWGLLHSELFNFETLRAAGQMLLLQAVTLGVPKEPSPAWQT